MNLSADTLDYINSLQDKMFGSGGSSNPNITPTVAQSGINNLANAAITPWTNATNNFTKTVNDIKSPVDGVLSAGATDYQDLYNLKHNTFGGPSKQPMQYPKLSDEHLGPANENGVRPVLDSGKQFLQNSANNFGIGDNTSLLSAAPSSQANMGIQTPDPQQKQNNPLSGVATGMLKDATKSAATDDAAAGAAEGEGLGSSLESLLALL